MTNSTSDKNKQNGNMASDKKKHGLRVKADKRIVSDVLGAYTGTPVNTASSPDIYDLYPEQDADDL